MDGVANYENRPSAEAGANGWMHVVYRFSRPMDLRPSDIVPLALSHNRTSPLVGLGETPL